MKKALTLRRPMMLSLTAVLLSMLPICAAADETTDAAQQLVVEVARQLEPAICADLTSTVDLSRVRVTYVLASEGPLKDNAAITRREQTAREGLAFCVGQHPLRPSPEGKAATGEWMDVTMLVGTGIVEKLCELQPARLAAIMGHEFGHLTLGHLDTGGGGGGDMLTAAMITREREFAADQAGVRYAEQAGYANALSAATDCWVRMSELYGNGTPLEPKTAFLDHPTNLERAAELQRDPARREQWRAALSFENGVTYLQLGEWGPAQACFGSVLKQFNGNPETLTNLGYAKMMAFYAGLPVEERRRLGGEVSCLAFATTRPVIRGGTQTDRTPLREAVGHFRAVLQAVPDHFPAQSSLGAALLLNPDASADELKEAVNMLDTVVRAAKSPSLRQEIVSDAAANLALARLRQGDPHNVRQQFSQVLALLGGRQAAPLAFKLNYAVSLTSSQVESDWTTAETLLRDYLQHSHPESYYYQVAARDWLAVRRKLGQAAEALPAPPAPRWLKGTHVRLVSGGQLFAQEPWTVAQEALKPHNLTIVPNDPTAAHFVCTSPDLGLALRVSRGTVRVILLTSEAAPAVVLKSDREGLGPTLRLKVGQPVNDAGSLGLMTDPVTIGSDKYKLYRQIGIALKMGSDDTIAGIALISG